MNRGLRSSFLASPACAGRLGMTAVRLVQSAGFFLLLCGLCAFFAKASAKQQETATNKEGEALFKQRCAMCHEGAVPKAPNRAALKQMSPENVRFALLSGSMRAQGIGLSGTQINAIAEYLTGKLPGKEQLPAEAFCSASGSAFSDPLAKPHWNGWGVSAEQHRFQPAEMAQLAAEQVPKLKLKWAFGFPGVTRAYGQPAVAGGRLFVGSAGRKVYSLSAETGCVYWEFDADFPVRTAISVRANGGGWAVYFGDQHANAYAVDAAAGRLLWKTHLDEHPAAVITGAPVLAGERLFVPLASIEEFTGAYPQYECCKFRGSVSALDTATGKVIWKSYTVAEEPKPTRKNKSGVQLWGPSGAGVWSSPAVDLKKRMVYVGTGDNYSDPPTNTSDAILAFEMDTGKLAWSRQLTQGDAFNVGCGAPPNVESNCPESKGPDFDFGSSAMLVDLGGGRRALVAGQKSGIVYAVDPDKKGEIIWQKRVGKGSTVGGVEWGTAADAKNAYVAVSDAVMRPVPAETAGQQDSVLGVPFQLDPKAGGGLFALNLETGEIAWHTPHPGCGEKPGCSPAQSAAVTAIPGVIFSGGLDGHLRAYSAQDGRIVWDVDTETEYKTVNGVRAHGGSLDAPGAIVVGGMLYVNSGYAFLGSTPGNVLLAFSVDGK